MHKLSKYISVIFAILAFSIVSGAHDHGHHYVQVKRQTNYLARRLAQRLDFRSEGRTFSEAAFGPHIRYASVGLYTDNATGGLHRAQEAKELYSVGFSSEGAYSGKRVYMTGEFDFHQEFKQKLRFTSHLDPFRGTPYDVADAFMSDWLVQNYGVKGNLAYEIIPDRFSFGMQGSIQVARGAKQIDPRPKTNNNEIILTPSLSFGANGHVLSASGTWKMFRENMNLILYNASEPQKIYEMKGLGQYTYSIFSTSGKDRKYGGHGAAVSLAYSYTNANVGVKISGNYLNYGEMASDIENGRYKDLGKFFEDEWTAGLDFWAKAGRTVNSLELEFRSCERSGREIFQIFDPSEHVNAWVTESEFPRRWVDRDMSLSGNYVFRWLSADRGYSILDLKFNASYIMDDESYRVMDTYRKSEVLDLNFLPSCNFFIGKRLFTSIGMMGGWSGVSGFHSAYRGRELSDDTVETLLFGHDSKILSCDRLKIGGNLDLGWTFNNGSALVMDMSYTYVSALWRGARADGLDRHFFKVAITYNW